MYTDGDLFVMYPPHLFFRRRVEEENTTSVDGVVQSNEPEQGRMAIRPYMEMRLLSIFNV